MDMLSPGDAGAGRLLIVDDDAINRAILENIFAPFYPIDEAEDGDEGLGKDPRAPRALLRRAAGRGHAAHERPCGA